MESKGLKLKNFAYFTELSGNRSAITAVKNSNSVAFVSSLVAGDSLALGCVKAVEVDDFDLSRNIYLIHNKLKTLSPLSETFLNFMLKQKD
jgi:DNA-binding transcriptional LysR family regulator